MCNHCDDLDSRIKDCLERAELLDDEITMQYIDSLVASWKTIKDLLHPVFETPRVI
jgi:hypothetical protein